MLTADRHMLGRKDYGDSALGSPFNNFSVRVYLEDTNPAVRKAL